MKKVKVHLGKRSYEIAIGTSLLPKVPRLIKKLDIGHNAVIITNSYIKNLIGKKLAAILHKENINSTVLLVKDTEKSKSEKISFKLIKRIAEIDKGRGIFIIALGGGVIGDLAGFVASIYKRGVPFIQIPTTLLSQVDSAIGGKAAIDLDVAKNLVGTFYQPKLVISDISLLETLPRRQILNGLGEVVKYGIIKDPRLFGYLEKNLKRITKVDKKAFEYIVHTSSLIKARFVERDEFDNLGIRAELNLGHTVGHAVEAASFYSKKYNHGEAIAFGIVIASDISRRLKLIKESEAERITRLIKKIGLPEKLHGLKIDKILDATYYDKKATRGVNRFILPIRIRHVKIAKNISMKLIKEVLEKRVSL